MLGKPKFGVFAVSISSVFILSYSKELSDIEFVLIQRSLMYSMFDLLFETPSYRPVYVISDSEMKELKKNQHQEELDEITTQKVRLEDAFKAQLKHLEDREKQVKKELKMDLKITKTLVIPSNEIKWRFSRSSGPGGQNVNKIESKVEIIFDLNL